MKRRLFIVSAAACILLALAAPVVSAKETWTSVRSKNFFLIGNGGEKQVREVAVKLEQFRDVFTRLFSQAKFTSPVPTTVVVFKDDSSYRPFKHGYAVGYFQTGPDLNYITLTAEHRNDDDPFQIIFHEYVHLLINNTMGDVPVWFNEGLAEYYSTFEIDDARKVLLGKIIGNHVLYLRDQKMIPLRTLLTVDHSSPHYNERDKKGVFYAQSWAFVHYLLQSNEGARMSQLGTYLGQIAAGATVEDAFKKAFQADFEVVEKELKNYIQKSSYRMTTATFERKLEFDTEIQSAALTEAEALAHLGDLSLHLGDLAGAEKRLAQALQLDPGLAMANSSLGLVRVRQGKFDEAKPLLQKAVAANSQNYLVHFNYAFALSREGMGGDNRVSGYTAETAAEMRSELKKAIDLSPTFPASYQLLAFVNLVRGEQLDESITTLKRGLSLSPGNTEFAFLLAQLYVRKEDFKNARQMLEPLARSSSSDPQQRANAQSLLEFIGRMEGREAAGPSERLEPAQGGGAVAGGESSSGRTGGQPPRLKRRGENEAAQPEGAPGEVASDTGYGFSLRQPDQGEEQVQGLLVRLDCDAKGVAFTLKVGDRLLKLHSAELTGVQFTTYTPDVAGEMTCGPLNPARNVVVIFRPAKDPRAKFAGDLIAVEFVPKDFVLKKE